AAWACLDEYEVLLEKASSFPPRVPRKESPEYQLWYGQILSLTEAADALLIDSLRTLEQRYAAWAAGGPEVTVPDDARLRGRVIQAAKLASQAIDLAFSTAGSSSSGKAGTKLE